MFFKTEKGTMARTTSITNLLDTTAHKQQNSTCGNVCYV